MAGLGGNLVCPSRWIINLFHFCESTTTDESICLQIAKNLGPLVRCMCDDRNRLFFQSKKHWRESIDKFASLILAIATKSIALDSSLKEEMVETLFQNEDLLSSIVQWSNVWRKDATLEDTRNYNIYHCGKLSAMLLVVEMPDLRERIASMPVVSKYDDPNCTESYVEGLISHMQFNNKFDQDDLRVLQHLIVDEDCVDKGVIEGMIDFGVNSTDVGPEYAAELLFPMLFKGALARGNHPSDTRVAFAIRAGLINLCLSFMVRVGGDMRSTVFSHVEAIFKSIYFVALHKKTWKAIRHKRPDIEAKLNLLDANIIHDVKCKELLDMIKAILDMNGAYCCHCNKSLGRKERYQCGGCNRMTYCSRACQRADWLNGHNQACCMEYTDDYVGKFHGRMVPFYGADERAVSKLTELEINSNMIQLKLFLDHSSTILEQAKSLNIPLCDCVVRFELRYYPPKVTTNHYSECYVSTQKEYEASRSMKNIMCVYYSYNFTGDIISTHLEEPSSMLCMQKMFPFDWLTQKK